MIGREERERLRKSRERDSGRSEGGREIERKREGEGGREGEREREKERERIRKSLAESGPGKSEVPDQGFDFVFMAAEPTSANDRKECRVCLWPRV